MEIWVRSSDFWCFDVLYQYVKWAPCHWYHYRCNHYYYCRLSLALSDWSGFCDFCASRTWEIQFFCFFQRIGEIFSDARIWRTFSAFWTIYVFYSSLEALSYWCVGECCDRYSHWNPRNYGFVCQYFLVLCEGNHYLGRCSGIWCDKKKYEACFSQSRTFN